MENEGELTDFSFGGKKKKKKNKTTAAVVVSSSPREETSAPPDSSPTEQGVCDNDEERDYDYYELLERVGKCLEADGKSMLGSKKGTQLKLPSVEASREGTTKTVWANFPQFADKMNREESHFMEFVLSELGSNGSLDGHHALVIRGRFQSKQLETVVKHYVSDFVKCNQCGGNQTWLTRQQRLTFVNCGGCGSKRSVASVKKGYQAKTRYNK